MRYSSQPPITVPTKTKEKNVARRILDCGVAGNPACETSWVVREAKGDEVSDADVDEAEGELIAISSTSTQTKARPRRIPAGQSSAEMLRHYFQTYHQPHHPPAPDQ